MKQLVFAIHRLPAGLRSRDFSDPWGGQILDLGCGPGRQTLVLAQELQWPIAAVDFHLPYLFCPGLLGGTNI